MKNDITRLLTLTALLGLLAAPLALRADEPAKEEPKQEAPADQPKDEKPADEQPKDGAEKKE